MHNNKASERNARERKKNEQRKQKEKPAVQRKRFSPKKPKQEVMSPMQFSTEFAARRGMSARLPFDTPHSVVEQVSELVDAAFHESMRQIRTIEISPSPRPRTIEADANSFRSLVEALNKKR